MFLTYRFKINNYLHQFLLEEYVHGNASDSETRARQTNRVIRFRKRSQQLRVSRKDIVRPYETIEMSREIWLAFSVISRCGACCAHGEGLAGIVGRSRLKFHTQ